jgi:hypothetical protein
MVGGQRDYLLTPSKKMDPVLAPEIGPSEVKKIPVGR